MQTIYRIMQCMQHSVNLYTVLPITSMKLMRCDMIHMLAGQGMHLLLHIGWSQHQSAKCIQQRALNAVNSGTCSSKYLDVIDKGGLYSAGCGERSQQLGIELDLLQDGRQDLLTIFAYC